MVKVTFNIFIKEEIQSKPCGFPGPKAELLIADPDFHIYSLANAFKWNFSYVFPLQIEFHIFVTK